MLRDDDLAVAAGRNADPAFLADVLTGLAGPRKAIPARWFYDHAGSQLFEEITRLPEYYPTRTETRLLETHCAEVGAVAGAGRAVVEFGSGSSTKTPRLLSSIAPSAYVPIDISGEFLRESAAGLAQAFPGLPVLPVEANFMSPVALPPEVAGLPKLGFFPGSTIGNLVPRTGVDLLRGMVATMGESAMLLIGMDRVKDVDVLERAYDDAAGVTARFNLNLLHRINRELGADVPADAFRHRAVWNDTWSRIEMHLEATHDLSFVIAGRRFAMHAGETIHTENSHKYSDRSARQLLAAGGWTPLREWIDPDGLFSLILAEAVPEPIAP
ncbi:L-histidine N(alpha)-methyltransferase [Sphingomonas nostoxanthinifaciens]|uniref:L-histidine N(alpha)-methyltransferase n=1 Tax=Sphingomonas nostoxanthinifaciens TaxID=2872652 RepID=UPI001CC2002A|nr:L-histidine N(alpha)-methyltransferase [Sphingomonas nostoxanthinifaciens]UAK24864.1 L-histidine N(alpha)-methyltransferase [Sphingomonas nostoxanthinifaciens]